MLAGDDAGPGIKKLCFLSPDLVEEPHLSNMRDNNSYLRGSL